MANILIMYKGRLTDKEFNNVYSEPMKSILSNHTIELMPVYYPQNAKKVPKAEQREWLEDIKDTLMSFDYVLVSDPEYFKSIAKQSKAESNLGLVFKSTYCKKVLYLPSAQAFFFNPDRTKSQIEFCVKSLENDINGLYVDIGSDIVHFEEYPIKVEDIQQWLNKLLTYPALTVDIEAKSLKVTEAGIYTIGFAWNKHEGICFPVDAHSDSICIREMLLNFFEQYTGKLIVHKANYDIPVINFTLFQNEDITDIKNQIKGLNTLCRNLDDTLLISYLATNSCSGNILSLKELAQPFAGKWAVDVSDVTKVNLDTLMRYNLIDCLSTWYVYETYYPIMVNENQEQIYKDHFLPYLKDNIRMQLNGLPIDLNEVKSFKSSLLKEQQDLLTNLNNSKYIENARFLIAEKLTEERNKKLKKKVTTIQENMSEFNFNSGAQLSVLLYEVMALPVIELTDTKQPSTSKLTISKLKNHTQNQEYLNILSWLIDLADVDKILTAFIPAFEQAYVDKYGNAHLLGYFNLGGTVSGRLSSSNPNMQNLPATGSRFAKPVKKCFKSTKEWVFCGIDFNALEARIAAITTKDPARKSVYINGYDSHCMNAFAMLSKNLPDIVEEYNNASSEDEKVNIINSIAKRYPKIRQKSKPCGFLLQYGGTATGLEKNLGFSPEEAKQIYTGYCELYSQTIKWTQQHIDKAKDTGYVEVAFGLRLRTPLLAQSKGSLSNLASSEARTAGNALGQSWGLLNDRAMREVLTNIDNLNMFEDILPVGKVHDCCYYLVKNDIETISILNTLCVQASKWQNNNVIKDDDVHLSGQLDLFYPDWAHPITLPEDCDEQTLITIADSYNKKED